MALTFEIIGCPATKNTGNFAVVNGKRIVISPKPYRRWFAAAKRQVPFILLAARRAGVPLPIAYPVTVTAVWYRQRAVGDEDRYKVALGDFLQRAGVVVNDALIHWGGGCRRDKDPARPRTVVTIDVGVEPAI